MLTKDPQKRLSWPDLLHHPFVADGVLGDSFKLNYSNIASFETTHTFECVGSAVRRQRPQPFDGPSQPRRSGAETEASSREVCADVQGEPVTAEGPGAEGEQEQTRGA